MLTLEMMQVESQVILTSCAKASFKFTSKVMSDVEDLPLPYTHIHIHTHTRTYVDETFSAKLKSIIIIIHRIQEGSWCSIAKSHKIKSSDLELSDIACRLSI